LAECGANAACGGCVWEGKSADPESQIKRILISLLARLGVEECARCWFYRLFGYWVAKPHDVGGTRIRFYVPAAQSADAIHSLPEELACRDWFMSRLRPGDCVWDIGANIGTWAIAAAINVGDGGAVYAFEPEPRLARYLGKTARVNRLSHLKVMQYALGEVESVGELYTGVGDLSVNSIRPRTDGLLVESKGVRIDIRSPVKLVSDGGFRLPDAMKIDVEGAEGLVLKGCSSDVLSRCHTLIVEVHPLLLPNMECTVEQIRDLLAEQDFEIEMVVPRSTIELWQCRRSSP
jgi:FkbM family methyltransferase